MKKLIGGGLMALALGLVGAPVVMIATIIGFFVIGAKLEERSTNRLGGRTQTD
jgi:hypothetical protein